MHRYEKVHKPIDIFFYTCAGKHFIKAFKWQNKTYKITHTNLITKAYKGTYPVYLFSVSNSLGAYKIRLDTNNFNWFLEEIYWED